MSDKKVIGILGGMGPLATADLFQKITLHTAASCDQDHPRVCIDSNTNISDRTAALLHGGADPVPEMVKSAQRLASIVLGISDDPHLVLLMIIGVLYVLGMFMETLATIIILVPVLLPMILQLGIDPIHFGIVLVVTNNVAMLTPPLGVNLFVASRIAGISVERISVAVIPYLIALTLCILLFTYVPAISTWLPSLMGYGQ